MASCAGMAESYHINCAAYAAVQLAWHNINGGSLAAGSIMVRRRRQLASGGQRIKSHQHRKSKCGVA